MDADRSDLAVGALEPDSREAVDARCLEADRGQRPDECLFEVTHVLLHVLPMPAQVENRVTDELTWPVEGGLSSAIRLDDLHLRSLGNVQFFRLAPAAERDDRRVFEKDDRVGDRALGDCQGAIPDAVVFLEHPPVVTLGRRSETEELHVPEGAEVEVVETNRGGKSTFHGPGQLVCYPILDLRRHGKDVKKYVRDLEEALIRTLAPVGLEATRIDGLTGVWLERPPRKIASIGVHISRWVTTHGYALNVDLDPAPFTEWITACGLEDAAFTTIARELDRAVTVDEVRPLARDAFAEVFGLTFEEIPADEGHGLWSQPIHRQLAAK